ncbi:uncharacterized protein LOC110116129 [Dendrobium catenatum]|uniref:uncharacterized protein LOC110116129 n=1 Tax=Dendrobium catenatum TaxID=906689 RepID=UPI00109F170B|nr:uncharacterized protein LOC110116129 [Dendrobium catenatum]
MGSPQAIATDTQEPQNLTLLVRALLADRPDGASSSIDRPGSCHRGCIPKQPDSPTTPRVATGFGPNGALTLPGAPFQGTWARSITEDASPDYNSSYYMAARFQCWVYPGSLAVTRGILVSFFSSFPRSTCSLSVSRLYLSLDGIYRPIRAAFPNNLTRRQRLVLRQGSGPTGLSPSPTPLSRVLGPGPSLRTLLQTIIRAATWQPDSNAGPIPVRSPLLGESSQVSFPPLIDMLKLSRWPRPSWGRIRYAIHGLAHELGSPKKYDHLSGALITIAKAFFNPPLIVGSQREDDPPFSPPHQGARGATMHIRALVTHPWMGD